MPIRALQVLFDFSAGLLFYVYLGYPLLLFLLTRKKPETPQLAAPFAAPPKVSLLVSAHNERHVIAEKLRNALSSRYPAGLLEIIVISDCSGDGTDEIVHQFASQGIRLVRQMERLGKSAGLNLGVAQSHGDILVFSDANAMYQADAIPHLTRHFHDPHVGYVVGNARYAEKAGEHAAAKSEGFYWRLETWLKEKESAFGSVVGGDGAIYAIRRELFSPLLPSDINDFLNPLQIVARNFRGVYEPNAICYEDAGDSFEKEFRRKVRIISRSLNAIRRAPAVLFPWVQPRHWFALISHKLLRWFAPIFLVLSLLTSLSLWSLPLYRAAFLLQLLFYLLALVEWTAEKKGRALKPKLFYLPYYFCVVNLASLYGLCKFLSGSLSPTWQTVRSEPVVPVSLAKRGS